MPLGQSQIGMNPQVFETLIRAHGIRMIHERPLPCPVQRSLYSGDHDPQCPHCFNGFIYYGKKEFIGAFMGNNNNREFLQTGMWDLDQAQILLPARYEDGSELDCQFFDRILIPDFTVRFYQRVEYNQTGRDRLQFPVKSVDKLVDASGEEFKQGVDFDISEAGWIVWTGPKRPGYDLSIDSGIIYSVNYYCTPSFSVIALPHQLRVTQSIENGIAVQKRFQQLAVVRKDFVLHGDGNGPRDGQV